MRRSKEFTHHAEAAREFRKRLNILLEHMEQESAGWAVYRWVPRDGEEDVVERLKREVNEASGPAARAAVEAGVEIRLQEPAAVGGRTHVLNAIQSWTSALEPPNLLELDNVFDACDQTIGALEGEARKARAQERSLAGLVGRFARFPLDVRDAAGLPPKGSAGKVAVGVGVMIQGILVAVASAAVIALLGLAS